MGPLTNIIIILFYQMLLHSFLLVLLISSFQAQQIDSLLLLPVETTQNYTTDYAISFSTDTQISS